MKILIAFVTLSALGFCATVLAQKAPDKPKELDILGQYVGTAAQPLPDELKMLQPLIGEWNAEFIEAQSAVSPGGSTSKGKITAQWILDGHFLLGTTEQGKDRSIWIIGYDSDKKKYRKICFMNGGQIDESLGDWNGEFDTIDWLTHVKRQGDEKLSTTQDYIGVERGNGALRANTMVQDADGKLYRSLTIKATRRN